MQLTLVLVKVPELFLAQADAWSLSDVCNATMLTVHDAIVERTLAGDETWRYVKN